MASSIMYGRFSLVLLAIAFSCQGIGPCFTQENRGQLIMVGGGLGVSNRHVFLDLIEAAGGREKACFVLLPAANLSIESAQHFRKELEEFGIRADQVEVLDIRQANAALSTKDPSNVEKIDRATAVYMTGGDQVRLVQVLTNSGGSDTPLLAAMRRLYNRGGVIAGTSAGASAQGTQMLAASGLPRMLVDEGLDALDYGLTTDSLARGILVTKGLGFLEEGIIDQHFLQYRGRLGRLSRVTLEQKSKFGIGIDRDSAVRVDTNGKFIVTGGRAIVVHPSHASIHGGPQGIAMNNLTISLLSTGDIFNPADTSIKIHSSKHEIVEEDRAFNGGFLITDIGSGYAVATALIGGLAENSQESQTGIVLQYHDNTSHGYRYEFRKDSTTKSYHADSLDGSLYSMLNVRLEIAPIANGLHPSSTQSPIDLGDLSTVTQNAIKAVAFRGILPTNSRLEFRPGQIVTRREFAVACVRSVHLNTPPKNRKTIVDIAGGQEPELEQAIEAGFVMVDTDNQLCPDIPMSDRDMKAGFERLAKLGAVTPSKTFQVALDELEASDKSSVTRSKLAVLLTQLLFPQWLLP